MESEKAYAKVNLTLDIIGKRKDGYHDLRMVMQSISLFDNLSVEFHSGKEMALQTNLPFLPRDDANLVIRAARAFFQETGIPQRGMRAVLEKRIPVCAGTAGGSSDGAAMLRILRRCFLPEMSDEKLEKIGSLVGSDVPFCLGGGTALAEGRGERLHALPDMPSCYFVLCKPDFSISTPELFSQVRVKSLCYHPDTAGMLRALREGDLEGICRRLYNVFEDVLPRKYAQVLEVKHRMLELGATGASMTGSGPTVFGIFSDEDKAKAAAELLKKNWSCTHLAEPVSRIGG